MITVPAKIGLQRLQGSAWQKQFGLQRSSEVSADARIVSDAHFQRPRHMNAQPAVDGNQACVEGGMVQSTGSHAVARV